MLKFSTTLNSVADAEFNNVYYYHYVDYVAIANAHKRLIQCNYSIVQQLAQTYQIMYSIHSSPILI